MSRGLYQLLGNDIEVGCKDNVFFIIFAQSSKKNTYLLIF